MEIDPLLNVLLNMADQGTRMPVTLTVDTILISGHLIGAKHYYMGMVEMLETGPTNTPELVDTFADLFRDAVNRASDDDEQPIFDPGRKYLMLQNAVIYGYSATPMRVDYWRVERDAVSGFTIGAPSASDS